MDLEQGQLRRLRRSRALATGLLVLFAALFAVTLTVHGPRPAWLALRAISEAALVGGLADWFAITALFRRPLGLPIPHTAILPANKERIGEGLARFLDRNFLTPEVLLPELRLLRLSERLAAWLARRRNAAALAAEIGKALPSLLRAVDDRQVAGFLARALGEQLAGAPFAALLGRLVGVLTAAGYHEAVLDCALDYARDRLARGEEGVLAAVTERRRRWIPRAINREIARAMLRALAELLDDLRAPEGAARRALLTSIRDFASVLAQSPDAVLRGVPAAALNSPELRAWGTASWEAVRDLLLADLSAPTSRVERALAMMIGSLGDALQADAAMRVRLDSAVEAIAAEALPWREELIRFVAEVVRRWEPRGFTERIEAVVGADLQYIRINGTIVGGLVGGALYAISLLVR